MNIENRHISIWGDSILKGVILDGTDGRYRIPEDNCVKRFADITGSTISNHASFGMTTGKAVDRIGKSLARNPPEPDDIVIVEFGGNDCDFRWNEVSADPGGKHLPNTPIGQFGARLQGIVDLFLPFRVMPILMALPPLEPGRFFRWISRGLDADNILKWLGDINKIYRWQEAYNDIVVRTATENSLRIIDIRKDFLVSDDYCSKFCEDGIHPNEAGQATILDSVLAWVRAV